jgi:hypothetical protein
VRCASCGSTLEDLGRFKPDGTPMAKRAITGFAAFVKEQYGSAKKAQPQGTPHKVVMQKLSEMWKQRTPNDNNNAASSSSSISKGVASSISRAPSLAAVMDNNDNDNDNDDYDHPIRSLAAELEQAQFSDDDDHQDD